VETLELLEELLADYPGTLLLVSHDREFLDNAVTSCLVFEGAGKVSEHIGGYSDWEAYARARQSARSKEREVIKSAPERPKKKSEKLSYKDQRELEALPQRIEALEVRLSELQTQLGDPDLYRTQGERVSELQQQMSEVQQQLDQAYERWETLESI
jgi:ATP-binding cassette subfamily F protein uup